MDTKLLVSLSILRVVSACLMGIGRPITQGLVLLVTGMIWLVDRIGSLPASIPLSIGFDFENWWGKRYKSWVRFFRRLLEHKSWRFLTGTGLISITILCL